MRDAFGGLTNMVIIVVFLVLVSGYLAFNVNYTKAFRVKNKIVSALEEYEGNCPTTGTNPCREQILSYMGNLGYNSPPFSITGEGDWKCADDVGYCILKVELPVREAIQDTRPRAYYKVVTQIHIDIPIINKILPHLKFLRVTGATKQIVVAEGA